MIIENLDDGHIRLRAETILKKHKTIIENGLIIQDFEGRYSYNEQGQKIRADFHDGGYCLYFYNEAGQDIRYEYSNGRVYRWFYDDKGREIAQIEPTRMRIQDLDSDGKVIKYMDAVVCKLK